MKIPRPSFPPRPTLPKIINFPKPAKAIEKAKEAAAIRKQKRAEQIDSILSGNLPDIDTSIRREAGEICHLTCIAIYQSSFRGKPQFIPGRLVLTSRKIHFLSLSGYGWVISHNAVQRVSQMSLFGRGALILGISQLKGSGIYLVGDAPLAESILQTVLKIADRKFTTEPSEKSASRHIPQHVKNAVWQRDGGRCVECDATEYLEFDHIIPFSLGGASTEGNVQILCRRCNGEKSDRI